MFRRVPQPPVSDKARAWVEGSLAWFVEVFGVKDLQAAQVVLPTRDFFPDAWDGAESCLEPLLHRVAGYMNVDAATVALHPYRDPDEDLARELRQNLPHYQGTNDGAAGRYHGPGEDGRLWISIKVSHRMDALKTIATMAHELSHAILLGGGLRARDAEHMEPLTDLFTVFRGFGVINSTASFRRRYVVEGTWQGTTTERLGYLPEETFGYALAVFADLRGETKPVWAKQLTTNVGAYFEQSRRFIEHSRRS